uniref:Cytochrome c oxidase assembly protein CtaG n=2 Tax=Lotharella globosa TaxID=91324 RepID=A0A7S3ZES4_9EUKA
MGLSYAAVPLYQAFCQVTGYGGTVQIDKEKTLEQLSSAKKGERQLIIKFDAGTGIGMPWKFKPLQSQVQLVTGETVLAFYNAHNPTNQPMTGVATYNVTPMKAGLYFNKVQCFCFHEQRLQANENVDMPVFFFIDNEFELDPRMDDVQEITLSYTFFPIDDEEDPSDSSSSAQKVSSS